MLVNLGSIVRKDKLIQKNILQIPWNSIIYMRMTHRKVNYLQSIKSSYGFYFTNKTKELDNFFNFQFNLLSIVKHKNFTVLGSGSGAHNKTLIF